MYKFLAAGIFLIAGCSPSEPREKSGPAPQMDASQPEMHDSSISFKIIPGENGTGFGYDIFMQGKLYVHQPVIPAVEGNKSFSSEEKASRAAQLVVFKIQRNILPPTVEVRELDSLGLLDK